jgi:pimeloyl-ACP methyl ester carboxylesterase
LVLVASCASAPSEEREPEPERESGAESVPPPAQEIAPEATPEPAAAPAGVRGPWTEERTLESAAYEEPGAPSVIVHAPPAFDPARPLRLAVFLHGWSGCARVLVHSGPLACKDGDRAREGWDLGGRFDEAGTDALLVVPQLAFLTRNGNPGRFLERGRFRHFVEELLTELAPQLGPGKALADVESITLLAHSAGFETALAVLARGEIEVRNVVLFDALYAGVEPFGEWALARDDRRLVSLYTGSGRTAQQTRRLARRLEVPVHDGDRPLTALVREARVVIARSPAPHGEVPARHMAELLSPLGLSARQ